MKKSIYATIFVVVNGLSVSVIAQAAENTDPRDVEIGAGGNIKLEKRRRTKLEAKFKWHAHTLWESRYITEGRDNLSGKGIYSLSTEFTYQDINFIPWITNGVGTDYSELNLNIFYGEKLLNNLEVFFGYNRIESRENGNNTYDNELNLDLVYFYNKQFYLQASNYYSFDAEGAFSEVTIRKGYRVDKSLSLDLSAIVGFNFGYVVDGHRGLNHGQLRADLYYTVMKSMDVYAYTGYTAAIGRDSQRYAGDVLLRDQFWGGVGLSYRF